MAKRRNYDDQFRASAVVMLEAAGYPDTKGALMRVSGHLKVPHITLSRWFHAQNNPPPNEVVYIKKQELADVFEDIAYKYLEHASKDDVIDAVSGSSAVVTAATAVDKMRLLRGLPTEIVQIVPDLVNALKKAGYDPVQVFNDMIAEVARADE